MNKSQCNQTAERVNFGKMSKAFRVITALFVAVVFQLIAISSAFAAGSITPSGGGKFTNGSTFTITVKASGATFDSLQGTISVSGPVSVVSFSAGGATWLPGKTPANNGQFVGITSPTTSLTVATIKLKGTKEGSGKVTVSGVRLAKSGAEVGTGGGSTSFTITRAPTAPGTVTVTSSTHPDPEESYETTSAAFAWSAPANGATGYGFLIDASAETTPPTEPVSTDTAVTYDNLPIGTHYFHIRALNGDGWGPVTHYKVTIKHTLDESLTTPTVASVTTGPDYVNDIELGNITGIVISGTGPAGYSINLNFAPTLNLPAAEAEGSEESEQAKKDKYAAPVVGEDGTWTFPVTDPVKVGFYKLSVQAVKDGVVSAESVPYSFELSVADGGSARLITSADTTEAYKQAEAAKVLAAKKRATFTWGGIGVVVLGALLAGFLIWRRRQLPKNA